MRAETVGVFIDHSRPDVSLITDLEMLAMYGHFEGR